MTTYKNSRYPAPINHNIRKPGFVSSIARALGIGTAFGAGSAVGDELGGGLFDDEPTYEPVDPIELPPADPEPYVKDPYPDSQVPEEPYGSGDVNSHNTFPGFPGDDGDEDCLGDMEDEDFTDMFDPSDMV